MAEENPLSGYDIPRHDRPLDGEQGARASSGTSPAPRRRLRLAVAGGGTGGHVFPGLHLLDSLQEAMGQNGNNIDNFRVLYMTYHIKDIK